MNFIQPNHWLFKLKFMRGYDAITLGPFVLFRGEVEKWVLVHETIHLLQIQRMMRHSGPVKFYTLYVLHFLWNFIRCGDWHRAYWDIPYEVEARRVVKRIQDISEVE